MSDLILDTVALLAYFDRSEAFHLVCLNFLKNFRGRFLSTEAVLTELLYMLGDSFENQRKCLEFFLTSVRLVPASPEILKRALALMEKYQDIPMDFADATLVTLAEDLQCPEIFTLDRRGFETYRWGRNRVFKIRPE